MTTDEQTARDYLDGWADPARHGLTIEAYNDLGHMVNFRAVCACGWKGLPVMWRSQAERACPVLDILQERQKRSGRP